MNWSNSSPGGGGLSARVCEEEQGYAILFHVRKHACLLGWLQVSVKET